MHRHRRPLLRYCRRLVVAPEPAEDVLQQGLLQAWVALAGETEVRDPRAWLYRIVHNAAISSLRRNGTDHVELIDALPGASGSDENFERAARPARRWPAWRRSPSCSAR